MLAENPEVPIFFTLHRFATNAAKNDALMPHNNGHKQSHWDDEVPLKLSHTGWLPNDLKRLTTMSTFLDEEYALVSTVPREKKRKKKGRTRCGTEQ
jgi:hypothetical protein